MNPLNPESPKPNELGGEPSLEQQLAYLATELLGWEPHWTNNGDLFHDLNDNLHHVRVLLTGAGMLNIIEAMYERGYRVHLCSPWDKRPDTWLADFFVGEGRIAESCETLAPTLCEAVAHAAYAALQETAHG